MNRKPDVFPIESWHGRNGHELDDGVSLIVAVEGLPARIRRGPLTFLTHGGTTSGMTDDVLELAAAKGFDVHEPGAILPPLGDFRETVVFRWLAAGDAGDLSGFDALLHRDVVVHAPLGLSTESIDAEKAVWADARTAMPDIRHDVQEVVTDGNVEMARVIVTGTLASSFGSVHGTGRSFRIDQAVIAHLRDGKIAEAWEIADVAALREQVAQ